MFINTKLYDIEDFTIIPAVQSYIHSRSECNPYYNIEGKQYLPIFVSPMECVINKHNFDIYDKNKVIPILPRTETFSLRCDYAFNNKWAAFSLSEFQKVFCEYSKTFKPCNNIKALIDQANGHMSELPDIIKTAKEKAKENKYNLEIMVGNIANPDTYKIVAEAGADYARMAIGSGNCCITGSNTAQGYPMGSLILNTKEIKDAYNLKCAIVADGGISNYKRAITAYALGADYVMIGSTFGACFESASNFLTIEPPKKAYVHYTLDELQNLRWDTDLSEKEKKEIIKMYSPMTKAVWGMSTRKAQISIALAQGKKLEEIQTKTSEGVEKKVNVEYTLAQWLENFTDYFKSAMSYDNITEASEYIGKPEICLISEKAKQVINK